MNIRIRKTENSKNGLAIIELLVALAIASLFLTGAVLVAFGGQTAGLDVGLTSEGLYRLDFHLSSTTAAVMEKWDLAIGQLLPDVTGFYTGQSLITDISPCVKHVGAKINWTTEKNRGQGINLGTLTASVLAAKTLGDGCDPFPPSGWDTVGSLGSVNVEPVGAQGTGVDVISIDDNKLYAFLTTSHNNLATADFWVMDVSNPSDHLPFLGSLNIVGSGGISSMGLNAVDVIDGYAFAIRNDNVEQLQVINIANPSSPIIIATSTIPLAPSAIARSLFYYDQKVYLGTQYLPCPTCDPKQNNELHIFDVSNPANPVWQASIDVDRNVNDIVVRDGLAYLATGPGSTSPYTPMKIYDVDPSSPNYLNQVGVFRVTGNQSGRSIYLLGHKIYLGRDRAASSNKDFHIIDVSDPTLPQEIGAKKLNMNPNTAAVIAIAVQGHLAFLGTSDSNAEFQVFDISDPSNIKPPSSCSNTFNFPQAASGIVYANNLIFASVRSNEALRIIHDTPNICTP